MIVAVVGSRDWPRPGLVSSFVRGVAKKYPDAVIVSGGCQTGKPRKGVDWAAEKAALDAGLRVVSFRPQPSLPHAQVLMPHPLRSGDGMDKAEASRRLQKNLAARALYHQQVQEATGGWRVVRFDLALDLDTGWPVERQTLLPGYYDSFAAAARIRNSMVVEIATQVVAFHDGQSPGTWHVRREAARLGRPLHLRGAG